MPRKPLPDESPLEAQLRERRVDRAVAAALSELDGAGDETMLAMMVATKLVVTSAQALEVVGEREKALRMVIAAYADLSTRVLRGTGNPTSRLVSES